MKFYSFWFTLLTLTFATSTLSATAEEYPAGEIRLAFSSNLFQNTDRNDAAAALKAWASAIAKERAINDNIEVRIMETSKELIYDFNHALIDAATVTSDELNSLTLKPTTVYLPLHENNPAIQYVLLVRKDGVSSLEQLEPQSVNMYRGQEMTLAKMWVTGLFTESSQPATKRILPLYFSLEDNVSQAIFKVFFHQTNAAVVTLDAFMLAAELNPQLAKELQILRKSGPLIPGVFIFRPNWIGPSHDLLTTSITELHNTPGGQQVLTVFKSSCIKKYPAEIMDETYAFIERHKARGIQP
jgi:hypothetical protein